MSVAQPVQPHFKLFGFPVRISPFFLLVVVLFGLPQGEDWSSRVLGELAIWAGVVFVSILWHELGHAFAMRRFGFSPAIALHGLGGHTTWGPGPPPTAVRRIVVSVAGPGFGFVIGVACYFLTDGLTLDADGVLSLPVDTGYWALDRTIALMVWINLGWGMVNLLPMLPWDGGHVLEGLFDLVTKGKGRKPAAVITVLVAVAIGAWALSFGAIWPALLCGISVMHGVRAFRAPPRMPAPEEVRRARLMLEKIGSPAVLVSAAFRGQAQPHWAALAAHLEGATIPELEGDAKKAEARELSAWAWLLGGDLDGAIRLVDALRTTHEPSPLLAGVVAARAGDSEAALALMEAMPEGDSPGARDLIVAYASASLGRAADALEAIGEGPTARTKGAWIDAALFQAEQFDAAAHLAEALFERFRDAQDAYNAACSHARAGRPLDGLRMLEAAVDAGYADLGHLEEDDDMKAVRKLDGYNAVRDRLA